MDTATPALETRRITYDDGVVRGFVWASVAYGAIGLLVGLVIALQLSFPGLNLDTPWLTFGRLRPLHTNAVIFALVGNMMFAGIYYSSQRLLKTRMASDLLSRIHLWGWQIIILGAAITLPLGMTQGKEYAELEWFLDLAVVVVWVAFAVNFFWTLAIRNEKNLYVSIWFYISTILTIAVLYIVNNMALPVTGSKSYGAFSGAQDALTQWWYGHNAVAFFLTTPILGIMYYFLPKAADRPVFSYRLSIVHFWSLVFIYIWAGPHHLLNTALPDWAQSLGMVFSLMLWAPSWGGMLNGLLTLRGAWHEVRTDPVLKFFVAGVTFYGMATFEGPLLSIKSVSALGHYTDWIIGHVHSGALGWNGFMAAGMFYWLVPKLFGTKLHSIKMADYHFWIGLFGILMYVASMWVSGVSQGLQWREVTPEGALANPDWGVIVNSQQIMYVARSIGGGLFVVGWLLMIYNLVATAMSGRAVNVATEIVVPAPAAPTAGADADGQPSVSTNAGLVFSRPVIVCVLGLLAGTMFALPNIALSVLGLVLLAAVVAFAAGMLKSSMSDGSHSWHEAIEQRPLAFSILTLVAVVIGGLYELLPGLVTEKEVPYAANGEMCVEPYTPLELAGRDIYVREGCYVCHSQMIRPFLSEQIRYGDPSRIEESMWDHPFQWGSKRTGPDLARIGTKYNEAWHWDHMWDPRAGQPFMLDSNLSIMPRYPWLFEDTVEKETVPDKMSVLAKLGTPYSKEKIRGAIDLYDEQAQMIVANLAADGKTFVVFDPEGEQRQVNASADSEIVAVIAYLMRLGRNLRPATADPAQVDGGR